MNDLDWDRLLKIRTSGRDDSHSDQYRFPYEPTPYSVLEWLANSGYLRKNNTLLDYGCGKGRVDFFLNYQVRCRCIGIEYDERIYQAALWNAETAASGSAISGSAASGSAASGTAASRPAAPGSSAGGRPVELIHRRAEQYEVPPEVDRIFFFNPFSVEVLQKVMSRIKSSWYEHPRELLLFFYYPSDEYVSWLMTVDELMFTDEIDCRDLFQQNDERERILVFEMV